MVARLHKRGAEVSAFIEPIADQVRASAEVGCNAVELWTGEYAHARNARTRTAALKRLADSIELGHELGILCTAGTG